MKLKLKLIYLIDLENTVQAKGSLPIRGSQIYYETLGDGEPLLLLHGGLGTVEDFAFQTPELAKRFKVIAFERPGHGRSADNGEPFTFNTMTECTIDFMDSLSLKAANLVGWSDGAAIALMVAIARPDLVRRIVSVGGFFNTGNLSAREKDWLKSATPESFRKAAPEVVKRYDEFAPDGPAHFPIVFEKTVRMWLDEPDIQKEELARISAPTLVMAGDREAIPQEHTLELFRSIRDAQLCIVPESNHFLLSENPVKANRAILEFLLADEKSK
ncbi:MAG TPA: alpha/beta hydrolase [Nitrososphaerales archaeon]|nr:alpha/beta hydrolase [Nitrososphaerales archaeon]